MSDETPDTTEAEAPSQEDAPKTPETFSLEYVQELRNQAAKYRTEKKAAAESAKAEAIKEYEGRLVEKEQSFSGLREELDNTNLELQKLRAVLAEGIASEDALDVASLVQGTDDASISDSVKRVKSLIGKAPEKARPIDPSQGSGNHVPLNGDPILETVRRMVGA
jgi:type I restriction-modification system DNA methylase subunit